MLLCMIESLVHDYFYTFRYCWTIVLLTMADMINNYINFLDNMTVKMLEFPTCLILSITSITLLFILLKII
jgi:hypothetical protein